MCPSFVLCFIYVHYPIIYLLCGEDRLSNLLWRKISTINWCFHWDLSAYTQYLPLKNHKTFLKKSLQKDSFTASMIPRKQIITLNGATSKGKAINTIRGTIPPLAIDQPGTTEDTDSSSPSGPTTNVQAKLQLNSRSTPLAAKVSNSTFQGSPGLWVFEKAPNSNLRLLLRNKQISPTHHVFSGQNNSSLLQRSANVPHLPFHPEGVISYWFYSLHPHSLHNFEDVSEVFLTRYASL